MTNRVTQRQPLACRECTRRKRKCDKTVPCSRCERLGIECSREVVQLRKQLSQNNLDLELLGSVQAELDQVQSVDDSRRIVQKLIDHIGANKSCTRGVHDTATPDPPPTTAVVASPRPVSNSSVKSSSARIELDDPQVHLVDDVPAVTAIEQLAWTRSNGDCYPHWRCSCRYSRKATSTLASEHQGRKLLDLSRLGLPERPDAEKLVSFHLTRLAWHHNCIHSTTFWKQCRAFWQTGTYVEPQWLALYCSVLSTSLFCVQNSARYIEEFDLEFSLHTASGLFNAMVEVLYDCNFLQQISFYAVQAIVVSGEVAHNLGLSQLNATLFGAAVQIAQCLGVHKIRDTDNSGVIAANDSWTETVEKEVGRRVWCQMLIQDYFTIPFTDACCINPKHYSTSLPGNAHDHDLIALPDAIPTISSYTRSLAALAKLMPNLIDGLGSSAQNGSLEEQYQHVRRMDERLRSIVRTIPEFLLRRDPDKETRVSWLSIARRSLAITAAEKIIMIHRSFLFRSFTSGQYEHTRQTCVSAATTILREHESLAESGDLCLWTHSAFCITATVILCFEIVLSGPNLIPDRLQDLHRTVQAARNRLQERQNDVLARRGIVLIQAMLPELGEPFTQAVPALPRTIDVEEISRRFSCDWAFLNSKTTSRTVKDTMGGSVAGSHDEHLTAQLAEAEFDSWFEDVFTSRDYG